MIIVTSISPSHKNKQLQIPAINSWCKFGKCYSLNEGNEVDKFIKEEEQSGVEYGVLFVPTHRTIEYYVGRPLVSINAIIDFAKDKMDDLLIVNSDIIISRLPTFRNDGVTMMSRYDYTDDMNASKLFDNGWDVFYIPRHLLYIFPPSIYGLGAAFWDFWLPYHCMLKGVPIYYPPGKFAFHKIHETQYDYKEWIRLGEHFRTDFRQDKKLSIEHMTTMAHVAIKSRLIRNP